MSMLGRRPSTFLSRSQARHPRAAAGAPDRALRLERLEDRWLLANDASAAINQFAYDVYEHMQQESGNLFFSPLSISTALAMTYAGAAGQTAAEMEQVLHFGDSEDIHAAFGELLTSFAERTEPGVDLAEWAPWPPYPFFPPDRPEWLPTDPGEWTPWPGPPAVPVWSYEFWPEAPDIPGYQLEVHHGVWNNVPLLDSYVDLASDAYNATIDPTDFSDSGAAEDKINDWVAEKTRGRITDLVSGLDSATKIVTTTAAYFNGLWDSPFDPQNTHDGSFQTADGRTVDVPLMYQELAPYFTTIAGYEVLELELGDGQASMIIALPVEVGGVNHLGGDVQSQIESWLESDRSRVEFEFVLELPRFDIGVETSLNAVLAGMGMPSAFGAADFSNMASDSGIWIEKVFHKATLEVNEQGTTAAAATEISYGVCFAAGTKVLTPEGMQRIELVQVGDLVLARDEHQLEGGIEPKVVEGTRQREAEILELHLGPRVIRTTELHPFFVEGVGWLAAGQIKSGDRIACDRGGSVVVSHVEQTGRVEAVYNLSVASFRTFFVSDDDWGFGVWTHNYCGLEPKFFTVDRPFHLIIRDNVTDTIAFMGRIDDPTQAENSVTPQVVVSNTSWGDYDGSGTVDQADYAVWRSSFGQTGPGLAADGNRDGRVDTADYSVWRDHVGQTGAVVQQDPGGQEDPPPVQPLARPTKSLPTVRVFAESPLAAADDNLLLLLAESRSAPVDAEAPAALRGSSAEDATEDSTKEAFASLEEDEQELLEFI